jgi:hypothetical protein
LGVADRLSEVSENGLTYRWLTLLIPIDSTGLNQKLKYCSHVLTKFPCIYSYDKQRGVNKFLNFRFIIGHSIYYWSPVFIPFYPRDGWTTVNHYPIVNIIMGVRSLHTLRASIYTMDQETTMDFIVVLILEHIKEIGSASASEHKWSIKGWTHSNRRSVFIFLYFCFASSHSWKPNMLFPEYHNRFRYVAHVSLRKWGFIYQQELFLLSISKKSFTHLL